MEPSNAIRDTGQYQSKGDGIIFSAEADSYCVYPQPSFHESNKPRNTTPIILRSSVYTTPPWATNDQSEAMSAGVSPHDGEHDHVVIGESCDVDMGTPTAANSLSGWREAHTRDHDLTEHHLDDTGLARWRIHSADEQELSDDLLGTSTTCSSIHNDKGSSVYDGPSRQTQDDGTDDGVVEIQAFREYSDADVDNLDILPSQDFDSGVVHGSPAQHSALSTRLRTPESTKWQDFRDGTQFHEEEASEVFDNVIYAPLPPPRITSTSSPQRTTPPAPTHVNDPNDLYESESELSDGYEVPSTTFIKPTASSPDSQPPSTPRQPPSSVPSGASSASGGSPPPSSVQWCARMSIKRDCSFIDHTLKHRRKHVSVQDLSESGEDFEERLKLVDGDDECDSDDYSNHRTPKPRPTAVSAAVDAGLLLPGFRPKKKRRKVRQLALDAFLKVQPSTSY